jgi:hypothetical protein
VCTGSRHLHIVGRIQPLLYWFGTFLLVPTYILRYIYPLLETHTVLFFMVPDVLRTLNLRRDLRRLKYVVCMCGIQPFVVVTVYLIETKYNCNQVNKLHAKAREYNPFT